MQLPQNKKEGQKVLDLIAIGVVVAVLYGGVWVGVYSPIRKAALIEIADLENKIETAERQIGRIPLLERDLKDVLTNLIARSEHEMLQPRLGNYLLPVREWLGEQARALDIEAIQVDEVGLLAVPRGAQRPASPGMQFYAVRVTSFCGYEDLRQWFLTIERENPMVAIGNVMIAARPDNPLQHQASFEAHFPVWTDPGYGEQLKEALAALEAETK